MSSVAALRRIGGTHGAAVSLGKKRFYKGPRVHRFETTLEGHLPKDTYARLSQIFEKTLQPYAVDKTLGREEKFNHVLGDIKKLLVKCLDEANIQCLNVLPFGSGVTGLYEGDVPRDIDLVLDLGRLRTVAERTEFCYGLAALLKRKGLTSDVVVARVPLVRFEVDGIIVEVAIDEAESLATTEYLRQAVQEDDRVKPLLMGIKNMAKHYSVQGSEPRQALTGYKACILALHFLHRAGANVLSPVIVFPPKPGLNQSARTKVYIHEEHPIRQYFLSKDAPSADAPWPYALRDPDTTPVGMGVGEWDIVHPPYPPSAQPPKNDRRVGEIFIEMLQFYSQKRYLGKIEAQNIRSIRCPVTHRRLIFQDYPASRYFASLCRATLGQGLMLVEADEAALLAEWENQLDVDPAREAAKQGVIALDSVDMDMQFVWRRAMQSHGLAYKPRPLAPVQDSRFPTVDSTAENDYDELFQIIDNENNQRETAYEEENKK